MKYQIKTPGKLFLLGEYSVLEGGVCVVAAVSCYAEAEIIGNSNHLKIYSDLFKKYYDFNSVSEIKTKYLHHPYKYILAGILAGIDYLNLNEIPLIDLSLFSKNFYHKNQKKGFGSSSAVFITACLACLRFFKKDFDLENEKPALLKNIFNHYVKAQGSQGSGADLASVLFGNMIEFYIHDIKKEKKPENINIKSNNIGIYIHSKSFKTQNALQKIKNIKKNKHSKNYFKIIKNLNEINFQLVDKLKKENNDNLFYYFEIIKNNLKKLKNEIQYDIITEEFEIFYEICKKYEIAIKPSGAGGGDTTLLFGKDEEHLQWGLRQIKNNHSIDAAPIDISPYGAMIIG